MEKMKSCSLKSVKLVKTTNKIDGKAIANAFIDDYCDIYSPVFCCVRLLHYGLSDEQLSSLCFEPETITEAKKLKDMDE